MNPYYDGTFLFDNDFPALQPDAPNPGNLTLAALGGKRGRTSWGTSAAKSDTPLSQDPVTIPFSKQRLLEEFGNYGFPLLIFNPGLGLSTGVGPCP